MEPTVAVIGATGAVGEVFLRVAEQREFPVAKLKLLASSRSAGKRLTFRGFIVWDFAEQEPAFLADVSSWLREGRIRYREDVVEGLEAAPEAFIGLLKGRNFGKLVVKL